MDLTKVIGDSLGHTILPLRGGEFLVGMSNFLSASLHGFRYMLLGNGIGMVVILLVHLIYPSRPGIGEKAGSV